MRPTRGERERESECIKTQRAVCRIEAKGKKGTVRHITPLSLSRWLSLVLARASRVCSLRPPPLRLYIINTARDIMYTLAADAGQHIRCPSQPTQHLYSLSLSLSSYAQPPHSLLTLLCPPSLHHPLILLFFFFSAFRFVLLSPLSLFSGIEREIDRTDAVAIASRRSRRAPLFFRVLLLLHSPSDRLLHC